MRRSRRSLPLTPDIIGMTTGWKVDCVCGQERWPFLDVVKMEDWLV